MHNSDMRCPGEPDNSIPADDQQVIECFKQSLKWRKADRLAAKKWWGIKREDRNMSALARLLGVGTTKLDNRLTWMRDQVIQNCVRNVNIYP